MLDGEWFEAFLQKWNELTPNARTSARCITIGSIFAPGLSDLFQIFPKTGAAKRQQGANHLSRNWVNARKSRDTGPPKEMGKHRFCLVVGGVSSSDVRQSFLPCDPREPLIARLAAFILNISL